MMITLFALSAIVLTVGVVIVAGIVDWTDQRNESAEQSQGR